MNILHRGRRAILWLSISAFIFSVSIQAQTFNVGTYNIRNDNDFDAKNGNGWNTRKKHLCDLVQFYNFDVLDTQEGLHNQLLDIKNSIPDFDYIGVGREDGITKGEYSAIFYNTKRFDLLDLGNFWISQNSEKPTIGWDAACIRICSWAKLKDKKNGKELFFFNVHTDHVGVEAREKGTLLILDKIKQISAGHPAILTGDFNDGHSSNMYKIISNSGILNDTYLISPIVYATNGTFNNFRSGKKQNEIIDYIFLTHGFNVFRYGILTDTYWDTKGDSVIVRVPSDHYPVPSTVELK